MSSTRLRVYSAAGKLKFTLGQATRKSAVLYEIAFDKSYALGETVARTTTPLKMRDYKAIAKAIEKDTCKGQRYCDKGPGERRFQLFCSAENNAADTAAEGRFVYESDEYWECIIQSLECLLCERSVKDSDIAYFKKFGVAP